MATHTCTTGHSPRERSRLPIVAAGGPVTRALAVMAAADPNTPRIVELRRAIAERIAADLDLLDALDGDPDLEPSFGSVVPGYSDEAEPDHDNERDHDDEPSLSGITVSARIAMANGGCFDGDDEPSLGSLESARSVKGVQIGRDGCDLSTSQLRWGASNLDDREAGDDNGLADTFGMYEQMGRHLAAGGSLAPSIAPLFRIEGGRLY